MRIWIPDRQNSCFSLYLASCIILNPNRLSINESSRKIVLGTSVKASFAT